MQTAMDLHTTCYSSYVCVCVLMAPDAADQQSKEGAALSLSIGVARTHTARGAHSTSGAINSFPFPRSPSLSNSRDPCWPFFCTVLFSQLNTISLAL